MKPTKENFLYIEKSLQEMHDFFEESQDNFIVKMNNLKPNNIMTKKDIQKRVYQHGKQIELSKFTWDEENRIFSSREHCLIINFQTIHNVTFKVEGGCIIHTETNCIFETGEHCIFITSSSCIFKNIQDGCILMRKDIYETIVLPKGKSIQLNGHAIFGFEPLKEVTVKLNNKDYKVTQDTFNRLEKTTSEYSKAEENLRKLVTSIEKEW